MPRVVRRVVDEDRDRAEVLADPGDRAFQCVDVGQVGDEEQRLVPGIAYLIWLGGRGHFLTSAPSTLWLIAVGPITVAPLALFAWAARRLPLATLGFLQFLGPTIGFGIGIAQHERFTSLHAMAFAFIWIGASVFVWGIWRRARQIVAG